MKCVICGRTTVNVGHLTRTHQNVEGLLKNDIDYHKNWLDDEECTITTEKGPVPVVCELDWRALMWNGTGYVWDGEKVREWDESKQEYVEPKGRRVEPTRRIGIYFEQGKTDRWEVKAG